MRIGKQDAPYSAICTSDADSITVRGRDLVGEIIGKMDFTSYFWLLVTGEEPNEDQAFFANAILCALAEHGLVPSVVAARMTLAAAPEAMQGAVAAGLLGCGSVVLGSAALSVRIIATCSPAAPRWSASISSTLARGSPSACCGWPKPGIALVVWRSSRILRFATSSIGSPLAFQSATQSA